MSEPGGPAAFTGTLEELDPEVAELIGAELGRERRTLDMVASENFAPQAVLEAQGSILTNKYADGYPGRREYDGCEYVDAVEALAAHRLEALFGAEHANVQPYSGSNANAAALYALCAPGDTVLGFDFRQGGHPTHYDAETFAGRFYRGVSYGVSAVDDRVDMDAVADIARRESPKVIFAGWSCYPRFFDFAAFRAIADSVGAYLVCDMAHFSGLVAAGLHPDPVPFSDVCTMTVHKTLGGARGGAIVCRAELAEAIDAAVFPGDQGGPLMHAIAAKAVTFKLAATDAFAERMARTVGGARTVAAYLNAAQPHTSMRVLTGGTDVHLLVLDTSAAAPSAQVLEWLHAVGVTANAMHIARDGLGEPASGLRLGTTSLATRGFSGADFEELGEVLSGALGPDHERRRDELQRRVGELADAHPVYAHAR